jgi:hypothetical protein
LQGVVTVTAVEDVGVVAAIEGVVAGATNECISA